jgi:copper(I)-binding protein
MVRTLISILAASVVLSACATAGPKVRVENAWARPAAASSMNEGSGTAGMQDMSGMSGMSGSETTSAVYFVIVNEGGEADTLIGATTDVANQAEIHETQIVGDVAEMAPVPRVDIPAHGRIEFKPGGYHVMLVGLTRDLKEGETLKLTLRFEKSGAITLDVPIQQEK